MDRVLFAWCLLIPVALWLNGCAGGHWVAARLPRLPEAVSNNAVASLLVDPRDATSDTMLFSFMGITDPNDPCTISSAAWRLDPVASTWTRIADVPAYEGRGRIAASAVGLDGFVYLFGGYVVRDDGSEATDPRVLRYDPRVDSWEHLSNVPVCVDDTVACIWQGRWIVLISGWHGPAEISPPHDNTRVIQVFEPQTERWETMGELSSGDSGLFGHAGAIVADMLIVEGGVRVESNGGSRRAFVANERVFVGEIVEWHAVFPRPVWRPPLDRPDWLFPTYRAAAAALDDRRLLLIGGADNPYNISGIGYDGVPARSLDQAAIFDGEEHTWTRVEIDGWTAVMDLRGLVEYRHADAEGWAIIGGMTSPGKTTDLVQLIQPKE